MIGESPIGLLLARTTLFIGMSDVYSIKTDLISRQIYFEYADSDLSAPQPTFTFDFKLRVVAYDATIVFAFNRQKKTLLE